MDEIRADPERESGGQGCMDLVQRHARVALDQLEQYHVEWGEVVCVAGCRIEYDSFLFKGLDLESCQSCLSRGT